MRLRTRLLTSAAVAGSLVIPLVPGAPVGAAPTPRAEADVDEAVAWLETQQKADGGFEVGGFPGFETPDAVFALASAGQTGTAWSTTQALAAVEAVNTGGGTPKDALDAVDDWVDTVQGDGTATAVAKAQQAAKVIALVTAPLGLSANDFDPSGDSEFPVDLTAALLAGSNGGDWGTMPLGGRAYVPWALGALEVPVPPTLVAGIGAAQHPDGGFDFTGLPDGEGFDADITAAVVIGLASSGAAGADDIIDAAVLGLAEQQRWTGLWAGPFDDGNANSTAVVMLMARSLGSGADATCWRDAVEPRLTGTPYPSPERAILRAQQQNGRIASPSDSFGINTFATSQAIQALAAVDGPTFYTGPACTQPQVGANERIAQAYYVDLLDRVTEPGGAAYWAGQFQSGMSPALLAKRFTGTPEYGRIVISRMVEELFDRPALEEELAAAGPLVKSGLRLELRASILFDAEYIDASEDDADWAARAFADAIGRPAAESDVDFILDQLDAGRTYEQIARRLVFSYEGRADFVRDTYQQLLRRNPSASDIAFWGGELARGVSPEKLVTLIIGSLEYKTSTQA